MRTTLDLDGRLLKEAMARAHAHTKTETIERGLRELIKAEKRRQLIAMSGTGYGMSLRTFLRRRSDE
ncbi:MAG: type II toxin-antitoxin system VapB family antitoxin [Candidatus Omnitrophica bacterium]|nr:type II toxin-antitoxin system VapB family antitoxin [Candidatus Omnitrophota bacterium]